MSSCYITTVFPDHIRHTRNDVYTARELLKMVEEISIDSMYGRPSAGVPAIKKVIFNHPATIVLWADGTKTVVKCSEDDAYDAEKGLAMAISKKALGNKGNYFNEIKKWVEPYETNMMCQLFDSLGGAVPTRRQVFVFDKCKEDSE